ncbi:AAA family ATPase [Polaribacter sp. 11A2H]|uniref:AAA family ATPase n=1 Tax=Polaribacter sp. 11A2H TaxID=2687290 RepID=UPI001407A8A3|nr:AAA family ATPase [Polaribacter sp. 11A2H]
MRIENIEIDNFRSFEKGTTVKFKEGVNVIIGHNNAGKSNLLKALGLVLNQGASKRLEVDDFNKKTTIAELKNEPPFVQITVSFVESINEVEYSDDLVTVSTFLTKIETPYEAKLTYRFYLPKKDEEEYKKSLNNMSSTNINDYWLIIKHQFLKKYVSKIYGGNPEYKNIADPDALRKIDFQFLDAIRDVERDLFSGKNTLLREVIDFFMDFDIKNDDKKGSKKIDKEEKIAKIIKRKTDFSEEAKSLIDSLHRRMKEGKKVMLQYATDTGASSFNNAKPEFDGHILDTELYSALKLVVEYTTGMKITIPATHNGLGYNNLIFMSLLLAKMQKDASGEYLGSNAKVFPVLVIEEPEAHLHPSMQYEFLKYITNSEKNNVRQVFITTHSPNITAAVPLDKIICLHRDPKHQLNIGYLGDVFTNSDTDIKSKAYVQRFLDTTKADMLFAKNIVMVEGITEQLLLPIFSNYLHKDLEKGHTSVINIGGRYFNHFLKLFDSTKPNTIHKKVACITDLDPVRKDITVPDSSFEKCYPFELHLSPSKYEYKETSNDIIDTYSKDKNHANIRAFSQKKNISKTFEYALAYENPNCELIVTESISNKKELKGLINSNSKTIDNLFETVHKSNESKRIIKGLEEISMNDDEKKKHLFAARYLNSLNKGENAFELANDLANNLPENKAEFNVPNYIKETIDWICE